MEKLDSEWEEAELQYFMSRLYFFWYLQTSARQKKKKEKKWNYCHSRKFFPLQMNCFLIFAKVFYAKFVTQITIRKSSCQKFYNFMISRKFLFAKVSAPKVLLKCACYDLYVKPFICGCRALALINKFVTGPL